MIHDVVFNPNDKTFQVYQSKERTSKIIKLSTDDAVNLYHKLGKELAEFNLNNVESIFWQMLMDLEGHLAKDDVVGREIVKAGYKTWNEMHPDNKPLEPKSF